MGQAVGAEQADDGAVRFFVYGNPDASHRLRTEQ
jgi:hypothetical protein